MTAIQSDSRHHAALTRRRDLFPYWLVLPICIALLLVDAYPFIYAFVLSFQKRVQGQPLDPFVGLANYRTVLSDDQFWRSLVITLKWTAASVAGQVILGTALALLVNGLRIGQRVLATLLLLPWVTPLVVAALTCRWMLQPDFGIFNHLIAPSWFGLASHHDWLGEASTVLPAIVAAHIWKFYGFVMIIVLARLKTVPGELYEAAHMDGAGRWRAFTHVTVPQIWDVLGVAILLMSIWTFNTFDMVYLMAQGHPAAAVLSIEVWRRFYGSFDFGIAAATAVLMFAVLFGLGAAYVRRCRG